MVTLHAHRNVIHHHQTWKYKNGIYSQVQSPFRLTLIFFFPSPFFCFLLFSSFRSILHSGVGWGGVGAPFSDLKSAVNNVTISPHPSLLVAISRKADSSQVPWNSHVEKERIPCAMKKNRNNGSWFQGEHLVSSLLLLAGSWILIYILAHPSSSWPHLPFSFFFF